MGAVLERLWSKGFLGGFGAPQAHPELEKLIGWDREELCAAFQRFCRQPSLAVTIVGFSDILRLESSNEDIGAFQRLKPKKDRVDMLCIFAAMAATSNQRFISRISFLFSIFDLDSNGTVNRAEFFIGVRALLHGLDLFFQSVCMPSKREMEDMTETVFDRIDADHSGVITLGEVLTWAYRTGELRRVFEPFPAADARCDEKLVKFLRDNKDFETQASVRITMSEHNHPNHKANDSEIKRRASLGLDVSRRRSLRPPKQFPKGHAWFIYRVFVILAGGEMKTTISSENLQKMMHDDQHELYIQNVLEQASGTARGLITPRERQLHGDQIPGQIRRVSCSSGDENDLTRLILHLQRYFHDRHAGEKLDALGEGSVTLRAFFCVIMHSLSIGEIETCLRWCHAFRAHDVLREYMSTGQTQDLSVEDVRTIFHAMDVDGNGVLTLQELMEGGELEEDQARALLNRLDEDHNGAVSAEELQGILRSMDRTLRHDFREAFEKDVLIHQALPFSPKSPSTIDAASPSFQH